MSTSPRLLTWLLIVSGFVASVAHGADAWRWHAGFTDASAPELREIHAAIHDSDLGAARLGVPVADRHFLVGSFDLYMISGTIYQEPDVQGYPAGAFFTGQATVTFSPDSAKARNDMLRLLGREQMVDFPVNSAYLFTLRGGTVAEQLGIDVEPTVPFEGSATYPTAKLALRQLGMELLSAFLNRDGRSKDAVYVLFAPEMIRTSGESDAHMLFAHDAAAREPEALSVFGHSSAILDPGARRFLKANPSFKYQFFPLAWTRRAPGDAFVPAAQVETYATDLTIGRGTDVEARTTIRLTPTPGSPALVFDLTPRLEVTSVTDTAGGALPFAQWKHLLDQPNLDDRLVVDLAQRLPAGQPTEIHVVSKGPLFDPGDALNQLAEEDIWYPQIDETDGALHELNVSVPKNMRAVAAGRLLSEEVVEGRRNYRFATSRPSKYASLYAGPYDVHTAKADKTAVELFYVPNAVGYENPKFAAEEVANAVKVFNRILAFPLDVDHLRAAATPTSHGRGFEGLLLLSQYLATSSDVSSADLFRAHEVAHQWWGHVVQTRDWPEDRWLSEAFAEYCAMEYYQIRFEKPARTREQMRQNWISPLFKTSEWDVVNLTGAQTSVSTAEMAPLIDGTANVYTKGPLVLHMLRYLFQVQQKDDSGFWTLLQDFLQKYQYQEVGTREFMQLTEQALQGRLDWFWEQWIYGTQIPVVQWSHTLERNEKGEWVLTVEVQQKDTAFIVPIPIYLQMPGGKTLTTPLVMRGQTGTARAVMAEKPSKVSLNDNYEALIKLAN